jgi:hypothetical protein
MNEPLRIDVTYTGGHWVTQLGEGFLCFDCATLMQLIEAVQGECLADEALLFVVDWATVDSNLNAELQFLEARKKSGALVISSVQEF